MPEHLAEHFPIHCAMLGTDAVRRLIQEAVALCDRHGFVRAGEVCRSIALMRSRGGRLATDPLLPWAPSLFQEALDYIEVVASEHSIYGVRPLLRASQLSFATLQSSNDDDAALRLLARQVYPQRHRLLDRIRQPLQLRQERTMTEIPGR